MALKDYEKDMLRCVRCSECKWIPLAKIKSWRFAQICPSIYRYNFHSYSGGGKVILANSLLRGRTELSDSLLDIIYQCQLCGACDINCRISMPNLVEPLDVMHELRLKCVSEGYLLPQHAVVIDNLRNEDTMMMGEKKAERGKWAEGLDVKDLTKEKAEVLLYTECMYALEPRVQHTLKSVARILNAAGIDFGTLGAEEKCSGIIQLQMGERGLFEELAKENIKTFNEL